MRLLPAGERLRHRARDVRPRKFVGFANIDEDRAASILSRIPAGRWGEASDLQGVFVFLASEAAAYVTGAVIPVDGGWLVR